MTYNISNDRTLDIINCEFFENKWYQQLLMIAKVTEWSDVYPTVVRLDQTDIAYQTVKDMATCEFNTLNGAVKAEACQWVKDYLVTEFDNRGLFVKYWN